MMHNKIYDFVNKVCGGREKLSADEVKDCIGAIVNRNKYLIVITACDVFHFSSLIFP